jgi:pimeloyl-ACP methyl ester carboxylesterase
MSVCDRHARLVARIEGWVRDFALLGFALAGAGCTQLGEIRTSHDRGTDLPAIHADNPSIGCDNSNLTAPSRAHSIEDYKDYWLGFVEFDDEGWMYSSPGQPSQLDVLQSELKKELDNTEARDTDFLLVAFVHGWHHNAHDSDCNVHEFRAMLDIANAQYAAAYPRYLAHRRRIIGVYVGWRGESIASAGLNETTVLDRRNAAERVAKGDVRELFATLRQLQIRESMKPGWRSDRMRTVVIGHSFGGLVAFHGLSPAVLNELTLTKPVAQGDGCGPTVYRPPSIAAAAPGTPPAQASAADPGSMAPVFPDMLVLINPAFEATRFESLHGLMRPSEGCAFPTYPVDRPKVIVITADNDRWTGPAFTAGRQVLTVLEAYPPDTDADSAGRERDSNTHAIGFTKRYLTHRLCLRQNSDGTHRAVAAMTSESSPDFPSEPYAPVWVVRAPPEIVDGHDGFLFAKSVDQQAKQEPYLLNWLVGLHTFGPGPNSPAVDAPDSCNGKEMQAAKTP